MVIYPELGKDAKVIAVLDDGSELDLSRVVESVEWAAQPGTVPAARIKVIAPEVDVHGWVEHLQLSPKEKVLRGMRQAEEREKQGLPRRNFGSRFVVEYGGEVVLQTDQFSLAWDHAWRVLRGNELEFTPECPASLEGANRLLEKRRRARSDVGMVSTIRIQEWIEGEWVG